MTFVRVKVTVMVTPSFEEVPIEIKANWLGTIVAHADKPTPCIEFNKEYRAAPFLVDGRGEFGSDLRFAAGLTSS